MSGHNFLLFNEHKGKHGVVKKLEKALTNTTYITEDTVMTTLEFDERQKVLFVPNHVFMPILRILLDSRFTNLAPTRVNMIFASTSRRTNVASQATPLNYKGTLYIV